MNARYPLALAIGVASCPAIAATYQVGPARAYTTLNALFNAPAVDLGPGDVVEVDPGTYGNVIMPAADGGAPGNPVVIRGVGGRPLIVESAASAGGNGIEFQANHVVFENFEVTGTGDIATGTFRCVYHHSHDLTLRNVHVHDCPRQGVLGADLDSGSLTIEYSLIERAGSNGGNHAIYMATDEVAYPGSVFRLRHSVVRDSRFNDSAEGGNLIKSRAERNEIHYNWLEGAYYHELELIGPDPNGRAGRPGWSEGLVREDSEVIGNVIVHTSPDGGNVVRVGGDGTGQSNGRYRFVNNTFVIQGGPATTSVFRTHFGIESIEMHNNVLYRPSAGTLRVVREESPTNWVAGRRVAGSDNWVETGATFLPAEWIGTLSGADPGIDASYRPIAGSPLLEQGSSPPVTPGGFEIANPTFPPAFHPPLGVVGAPGSAEPRVTQGVIDLGAFERTEDVGLVFRNSFED